MTAGSRTYACGLAHVGLCVPDLARAVAWYCEVLGFDLLAGPFVLEADESYAGRAASDVFGPSFQSVRIAHLSTGSAVALELFQFGEPTAEPRDGQAEHWDPGFSHICVIDRDIETRVAAIRENDGKVRTRIWEVFPGEPYRFCHCEDPFGNIIEIYTHSHERVFANRTSARADR